MAAETLVREGMTVQVYEAKPSVGRKFLMAGRGGLNITHSESSDKFVTRYGARAAEIGRMLEQFDAEALRAWVHALGIETFVGSSGRVFPHEMKAAPLLRAWMHRLRIQGVQFLMRHRWLGWDDTQQLRFETPRGEITTTPDATVLALGGGSWARLGSDGAWWPWLKELGVPLSPLLPSNGGFETTWSAHFLEKCAGEPIKTVAFRIEGSKAAPLRGECVVTQHGLEGGAIYALSAALRDRILSRGNVTLLLDLLPDHSPQRVLDEVSRARGTRSMSSHLRTRLGLQGVRAALLRERLSVEVFNDPQKLAFGIKNLPIVLSACRPIDEAISTAGGVQFEGMTEHGMLKNLPGVFCAGEMLDWEAPTGGYLLNGVMASGQATAKGLLAWLESRP
jgi:uncharacterized flavoprotein (TIGR03862 family)